MNSTEKEYARKREATEAGKYRYMVINAVKGQDSKGQVNGRKQSAFNERKAQEAQSYEEENPLNRTDARNNTSGTEQV